MGDIKLPLRKQMIGDLYYVGIADKYVAEIGVNMDGDPTGEAHADYIVKACNAHEDLVRALKTIQAETAERKGARMSVIYNIATNTLAKLNEKKTA
jgi:hypothetical protein